MAELTDVEIARLLTEAKQAPHNFAEIMRPRRPRGGAQRDMAITGAAGSTFKVVTRQNERNLRNFSAILAYQLPRTTGWFRLCRYNGIHGRHTNRIERTVVTGFHIHRATERYQELGMREDGYAEATDRYSDLQGAIECLFADWTITVDGPAAGGTVQPRFEGI